MAYVTTGEWSALSVNVRVRGKPFSFIATFRVYSEYRTE